MTTIREIVQPIRKCGLRTPGGFYLVTAEGSSDGVLPAFSQIDSPIPVNRKAHRGPLLVDGDAILARKPEEEWLVDTSADTQEKKKADQWAKDLFGMTVAMRLETGETKGEQTADAALQTLSDKIVWNRRVLEFVRALSVEKVAELPQATLPFTQMIKDIQDFNLSRNPLSLVRSVGRMWSLADAVQPRHRGKVVPQLVSMLVLLGLTKDAREMRMRYKW